MIVCMAHNNYYLDLCVETYVVNDGAVLLRLHEKYDFWTGPGGRIDPAEDINEAALRETWEEAGLEVTLVGPNYWTKEDTVTNIDLVPPIFVNRHRINDIHEHSACIFAAVSNSRNIDPQAEEDKGIETKWVTREELEEMLQNDPKLRPEIYKYAMKARDLTEAQTV